MMRVWLPPITPASLHVTLHWSTQMVVPVYYPGRPGIALLERITIEVAPRGGNK